MTALSRRLLLQTALAAGCCSQLRSRAGARETADLLCALGGSVLTAGNLREADVEAWQVMQLITAGVGLQPNFDVKASDSPLGGRAYATVSGGRRLIVYDATVFAFGEGRTDWIALGVMAHEIGHHLANHIYLNEISAHLQELEADHFAGAAVARLGGSLQQALAWTGILSEGGSETHPPRQRRIEAATKGWQSVRTYGDSRASRCKTRWFGGMTSIEGHICRPARVCVDGREAARMACRDRQGTWTWRG